MKDLFIGITEQFNDFLEIRYHRRFSRTIMIESGAIKTLDFKETMGVGVRALKDGCWGFCSTTDISKAGLLRAAQQAITIAQKLGSFKKRRVEVADAVWAKGDFFAPSYRAALDMPLEQKIQQTANLNALQNKVSNKILKTTTSYLETIEEKIIVNSAGACAHGQYAIPEQKFSTIVGENGVTTASFSGKAVNGVYSDLENDDKLEELVSHAGKVALDLLKAPQAQGGKATVILAPSVVGLLAHEAIGHTVEADFVLSGSVAKDQIGQMVASPLVTLGDSGHSKFNPHAAGTIPFDDEGVMVEDVEIIKAGKLINYLHNRETAALFKTQPRGNARAFLFYDDPIIRMRNTYIAPGNDDLEQMISEIEHGYLLKGAGGGQADATGEFTFAVPEAYQIEKGKVKHLVKGVNISGVAFDVLKTVDAISKDFKWDMGTGYCGKGQAAKVDGGGAYIRCLCNVGGAS